MKTSTLAALCAAASFCAMGAETESTNELAKTESPILSGYVSADLASGYLLYGALLNSEPCFWTDARADVALGDFGYAGLQLWSNSDLTDRRKKGMDKSGYGKMGKFDNENDFYIHYGNSLALTDEVSLSFELAHVWFTYHDHKHNGSTKGYASTRELNCYLELSNPVVTPYYFISHEYAHVDGTYMAGGLKKDIAVSDQLTLTPMLELNGFSKHYFGTMFPWRANGEAQKSGVGALMLSLKANYAVTDWFSIHAQGAFVTVVNDEVRDGINATHDSTYMKDFAWGMIGCTVSF